MSWPESTVRQQLVCEGNTRRQSPRNAESRETRLINVYNVDTCAFGVLILTSALAYVANYRIWNHPLQNIQTKQGSCLNFPNNEPKKHTIQTNKTCIFMLPLQVYCFRKWISHRFLICCISRSFSALIFTMIQPSHCSCK